MNKTGTIKKIFKYKELLVLAFPGMLLVFIFSYIPMYGLILPFKNFKYDLGFFKSPWCGLENFKFLFLSDNAWKVTRNTVFLNFIFIITLLMVSLSFALILNELSKKSVKLYQTAMFFPYFLSWVVISYVFLAMFDMEHGLMNKIMEITGHEAVLWYNEPKYWPVLLTIANTWKSAGYYCIIYYTGLMGIDRGYYEAAELDGAGKLQQVRMISIPLLRPLITLLVLLQVGKIFYGNFDMFYNVTRDAAALYPATDVIDTFVYRSLSKIGDVGMASAAGIYQSVVGFVIVVASNYVIKRLEPENSIF